MGLEGKVASGKQLEFEFIKKNPEPFSDRLRKALVIGGTLTGLAALVVVAGGQVVSRVSAMIPSGSPNVIHHSDGIEIEPYTYSGTYVLKRHNGYTSVMYIGWTCDAGDCKIIDKNGDKIADEVVDGSKRYNREADLSQHPHVFARADKDLKEALETYKSQLEFWGI